MTQEERDHAIKTIDYLEEAIWYLRLAAGRARKAGLMDTPDHLDQCALTAQAQYRRVRVALSNT